MRLDCRDNPTSASSGTALDHAERALWRIVSFFDAPLNDLDAATAADPAWMFPHVVRAGFLLSLTEPGLINDATASLAAARERAAHATEREAMHLAAAERCADRDWQGACRLWEAILIEHPRDLYALQWAHLFDFYRGDAWNLRHRPARVLPEWPGDDPLRPYVLGQWAFGLEENHLYAQAEAVGREAVSGEAKVPWATHAVAHVFEMQGRCDEGLAWMRERESDWHGNGFANHLWWHAALFHLERMDIASALAVYDASLDNSHVAITLNRLDAVSLLWRVQLLGYDVGERWRDAVRGWDLSGRDAGFSAFNDLHLALALIAMGRSETVDVLIANVRGLADGLLRGLQAYGRGHYHDAVELLMALRDQLFLLGGSHAQRDVVDQTLLSAMARAAGRGAYGRAMLNERSLARARTALMRHWSRQLGLD